MAFAAVNKMHHSFQIFAKLVLIKQTLFALPWLITAGILPYPTGNAQNFMPLNWVYLLIAFVSARISGMCFNRIIDMHIDEKNPRTKNRTLPKKELTPYFVTLLGAFFLAVFFFASFEINRVCAGLAVIIGLLLMLYSYTKRYTYLCHFVLGSIHFFTPLAAWAAVTGTLAIEPLLLGASLATSIIANDLIYACQDIDFDRAHNIYSIPAAFGVKASIYTARVLHAVSFLFLMALAVYINASFIFYFGISLIGVLFFFCHAPLMKSSLHSATFEKKFTLSNTLSGVILLLFVIGECIWRAL